MFSQTRPDGSTESDFNLFPNTLAMVTQAEHCKIRHSAQTGQAASEHFSRTLHASARVCSRNGGAMPGGAKENLSDWKFVVMHGRCRTQADTLSR